MLKFLQGSRLHRITVTVLALGLLASLASFVASRQSVDDTNGQLLRQDAAQGSLVLSTAIGDLRNPFVQLAATVSPLGVTPAVFDAAAAKVAGTTGSVALLHEAGGHLTVLARVGHLHRGFGTAIDDHQIMTLANQADANFAGVVGNAHTRWVQEVYGKGVLPPGFVIYGEYGLSDTVYKLPADLFSGTDAAVYVDSISPEHLVLRTTSPLPAGGQKAIAVVDGTELPTTPAVLTNHAGSYEANGHIIIAMSAAKNLSGNFVDDFPWILLLLGVLSTLAVIELIERAIRRRDEALGLVSDLEVKNDELDQALSRQAMAEKSLRQAQRMEAVGQLAGGIAHDFNNLLQAIISYSEFLAEALGPDSELQEDVGEVQRAAHRAAELTRQLLVFSRQDVAQANVLDLNLIVHDAERFLRHTLGEDVTLECRTAPDACCVVADAAELEMMLLNLGINARDAMPRGGHIVVTVDTVQIDPLEAEVSGVTPGAFARLRVSDDGEGMPPEVVAKAFEPFFTTKETGRGTGLGLAMVYGIVKRWSGDAVIASRPGAGTTVSLIFPLSDEVPAAPVAAPERAVRHGDRDVVLLVEDQEGVRESTARILSAAGYQVLQAENAMKAAQMYAESAVDILVTDIIMPQGVSGKELADYLQLAQPDLPVLFISGYSVQTMEDRGILTSSINLLAKPFTPEDLLEAVAAALTERVALLQ